MVPIPIIVCIIIILGTPMIPTFFLLLLDQLLIRIGCLVALLYTTQRLGPTIGIIMFVTIASLYVERNRRKVGEALKKLDAMEVPKHASVTEAYKKTMPVDVPTFDDPGAKSIDFMPHNTRNSDEFEPIDVSINQKTVLRSIYPSDGQTELYERMGFGHVDGVETFQ
jgi:hypothetical protein